MASPAHSARIAATSRVRSVASTVSLAAAFGVLTGAAHVLIIAMRHVLANDFTWVSREYVWMTPLGYVVLFAAIALPLALAGLAIPGAMTRRVAGFVFGTLGALALLLLMSRLHHLAALALAVGVGTQVASWLASNPVHRARRLGQAAIVLAASLGVTAGARTVARARTERARLAALTAAAPGAPNVLVIILDTVRAASMSFLGYPRLTTPALARRGAEGAVFEQAYATAPWTLPSHAGMFTGRYPSQLSTNWREPLDQEGATLAEVLSRHGYRTAGFVANHFYTSYESGLTRGFEHFEDYLITPKQVLLSTSLTQTRLFWQLLQGDGVAGRLTALARMDLGLQTMWTSDRKEAPRVTDEFLDWQAGIPRSRPFFAFLNYYDAHLPYEPPPPWRTKFAPAPGDLDRYDGGIAYMDDAVGRLFDTLAARGILDQTLVIVSSDHGEAFGEHGLHGHGNSLYLPELHVPLVVRYPARVPAGTRWRAPVTLRDLPATVLDAAGVTTASARIPGRSWLDLLATNDSSGGSAVIAEVSAGINTAPSHPVSRGTMQSLVTDSLHYIRNGDAVEELYEWRRDPPEAIDLARGSAERVARMRGLIRSVLGTIMTPPTEDKAP